MGKINSQQIVRNVQGREIDLREYFNVIIKKFWLIAIITVLTTLAGYYYSESTNVPVYQTSTRIIIGPEAGDMSTLMVMVKDPLVLEKVNNELELGSSASALSSQIDVSRIDESQVIEVIVTSQDPAEAAAIANSTAKIFKSEAAVILNAADIQPLSPARENPYPINENQNKFVFVGVILGLIAGTGLVFLLDSFDGSIRTNREVEELLGVPVLGSVSNMRKGKMQTKKRRRHEKIIELRSEVVDPK